MENNKIIVSDNDESENYSCFWSLNKLIKTPEIVKSIRSVITYRIYLNFYKKSLDELRQNPKVEIEINDIIKGELKGDMYRQIDNALAELKTISLKQVDITKVEGDITYVSLFRETGYTKQHGKRLIWVLLEEKAFPILEKMILDGYTKMPSSDVVNIPTIHATRTYEMLTMLSGFTDTAYFTIDNFKECVGISKTKYPNWPNLKQRVISPDQKIINTNTGISYDVKPKKVKRKVVGLHFLNIKNNSKHDSLETHVKIVREHIWPTHQEHILNNYESEHIIYYHNKCHKIADNGKIADLNSFIYKAIIEDKDNYNLMIQEKQERNQFERNIREAKEKELAESECFFNFSMACYKLLPDDDKRQYKINIAGFTDDATIEDIAVVKFSEENEILLKKSKSPEEFIKAYKLINVDI